MRLDFQLKHQFSDFFLDGHLIGEPCAAWKGGFSRLKWSKPNSYKNAHCCRFFFKYKNHLNRSKTNTAAPSLIVDICGETFIWPTDQLNLLTSRLFCQKVHSKFSMNIYEYSQPASTPFTTFILISFTHFTNTYSKKYIQLARRFARTAIVPRLVESLRIFGFSKEAGDEEEN